jgi:hypothetical protein
MNKQLRILRRTYVSIAVELSPRRPQGSIKLTENSRSDMKQLAGYSKQDLPRRWENAVVEARCASRERIRNIWLNIGTWSVVGALFVVALFLTIAPFVLL